MKKVVTNSMVAHLWANQSQPEAQNSGRSFYFVGKTVYSYGSHFPVAHITDTWTEGGPGIGHRVVLFNSDRYSITTSAHQSLARRALSSRFVTIDVPDPVAGSDADHIANLEHLTEQGSSFVKRAKRARTNADWYAKEAEERVKEFNVYKLAFFPTCSLMATIPEDLAGIVELKMERVKAQQEHAAQLQAMREAEEREKALAYVPEWLAGGSRVLIGAHLLPVYLRSKIREGEEIVETSKGAEVPYSHARRVWSSVLGVLSTGAPYQRNGHTIHAGRFTVDAIDADGTLRAGCHTILLDEMRRFAAAEGWRGVEPNL
jgi:hypothetical protein